MIRNENKAQAVAPENHPSQLSWLTSSIDAFELRETLNAYEVEELDAHDLTRFLPTIVLSEEGAESRGEK